MTSETSLYDGAFQFTTSQGGRHIKIKWSHTLLAFNSRPHKEVDLSTAQKAVDNFAFQFTTSQGGRPQISTIICII